MCHLLCWHTQRAQRLNCGILKEWREQVPPESHCLFLLMTSFTVVKKGQDINFESKFESLEDAKQYLAKEMNYNTFVNDLLDKKKVSENQIAWMHYLATQDVIDDLFWIFNHWRPRCADFNLCFIVARRQLSK